MENINKPSSEIFDHPRQELPNATAVLVLGIISIVGCFCYGIIGTICGIIALVLGSKAKKLYQSNPDLYTPSSYKNMNAGRICGIVGLSLSALYILFLIVCLIIYGASLSSMPWDMYRH
ncbi:CCC motif membrane protein [Taibaiella helva]|uniref:CCC motif membrane protein n=1 Tax=Taibaiella helva TaxID=2301235 RepID=UPI000E57FAFB|nr:CCC motif membrane protein [Taibaiella helva]